MIDSVVMPVTPLVQWNDASNAVLHMYAVATGEKLQQHQPPTADFHHVLTI